MKSYIQAILYGLLIGILRIEIVQAQSGETSTHIDERYEFRFDKLKARKIALQEEFNNSEGWDYENLLYSSIKGRNCEGAPARYVIVLANSTSRPDFPQSVIFDVTDSKRWHLFTAVGGDSLHTLITILKSPTFEKDIYCER